MISNYNGTLLRIIILSLSLLFFWFGLVFSLYAAGTLIFGYEVNFIEAVLLFLGFLLLKMFYPKNIFAT